MQNRIQATGLTRAIALAVVASGFIQAAAGSARADTQPNATVVPLNIPSQPLGDALSAFARQSGLQIMFYTSLSGDFIAPALTGTFSAEEALTQLLAGTALDYQFVDKKTIAIHPKGEPSRSTALRTNGSSDEMMRIGQAGTASSAAQDAGENEAGRQSAGSANHAADTATGVAEVVVTGSRFSNRTPLTSAVPLDLVTAEDLRAGGHTELAASLAAAVPAFNFTPISATSTFSATRYFTYRGLSPNEVLVLVNGKRWHSATVKGTTIYTFDFNSIAPTSIGGVEVLRDGASAQYGSDAIASVMNLRLRKDTRTELVATGGQYYEGDGATIEAAFDTGVAVRGDGFVHLSTYYRDSATTNRQGRDVRQQYFARNAAGNPVVLPFVNSQTDLTPVLPAGFAFDPRELTGVDRSDNYNVGNASRREAGFSFNSEVPITGQVTAYGFGGYTHRLVETPFVWRRPLENTNVRAIYPDGFAPIYDARIADVQLVAGLKGKAGAWDWDVSESWGFNDLATYAKHSVNASLGAASPTDFFSGSQRTGQATTNLDARREFDIGLRSPLRMAVGSEYRRETIEIKAGEPASYVNGGALILDGPSAGTPAAIGSQGIGGTTPLDEVDTSRDSIAAYVDIENQLTESLLLAAAGRYEHYDDFGSTVNGKLSFLQQFNPLFALRGSVSTGFRAPSLWESYFSNTGSSVIAGQFLVTRNFPVADPVAQALGAKPLEPEKSVNYSFGSVFTVSDRLSFTADVYRVYVRNAIIQSSLFTDLGTRNFLAARGFTGINGAVFAINAVDKRVDGLDLEGHFTMTLRGGAQLTLSSGVNFNDPKVLSVAPTPPQLAAVTPTPFFDQRSIVNVEQGAPRSRVNASAVYDYRNLQVLLRGTRYGSTREMGFNPPFTDQVFGAKWLTDVEVSYDLNKTLRLTAGAQNVFDVYPDTHNAYNNPSGITRYAGNFGNSPFGYNGGQYYLRALMQF